MTGSAHDPQNQTNLVKQDVALVAAHVLSGESEHGFAVEHRGQLMTLTGKRPKINPYFVNANCIVGPLLTAGDELAEAATQALGTKMEFEDISECACPLPVFSLPSN